MKRLDMRSKSELAWGNACTEKDVSRCFQRMTLLRYKVLTTYSEELDMPDKLKEFVRETIAEMLEGLTPEERMKGLPAEERLKGLSPEELLRALPPETIEAIRQGKSKSPSQKST